MKNFYDINKYLIIITVFLYLTFWGGIMAQMILGAIQILMSISIMVHFKKQSQLIKTLFLIYIFITVLTLLLFRIIEQNTNGGLGLAFLFIMITMCLALFHFYITYKIKQS